MAPSGFPAPTGNSFFPDQQYGMYPFLPNFPMPFSNPDDYLKVAAGMPPLAMHPLPPQEDYVKNNVAPTPNADEFLNNIKVPEEQKGTMFAQPTQYWFPIGNMRYIVVKIHNKQLLVNVRQFNATGCQLQPTRNGINLYEAEWNELVKQIEQIKAAVNDVRRYTEK